MHCKIFLRPSAVLHKINAGFSLTFEVEGHWLVSRQVPHKTEGRRPEHLGGSGGMPPPPPGKFLEPKSPRSAFSSDVEKKSLFCSHLTTYT